MAGRMHAPMIVSSRRERLCWLPCSCKPPDRDIAGLVISCTGVDDGEKLPEFWLLDVKTFHTWTDGEFSHCMAPETR